MFTVDEMRRGIEELGAKAYDEMSYYERWAASTTNVLIEKGIIPSTSWDAGCLRSRKD